MAVYGYGRVSTDNKGQTTDNQKKAMADAGFNVVSFFSEDGVSGSIKAFERPVFSRMLAQCSKDDTICITMVDRLGRSASDILNVVEELKARGIKLRVMQFDGMDITSSMGKMVLTCMAAMAELERNILIERTVAGLARTKEQGTKLGRPLTVAPETLKRAVTMVNNKQSYQVISSLLSVPKNTIHRTVKEWGSDVDGYTAEWNARKEQYKSNMSTGI